VAGHAQKLVTAPPGASGGMDSDGPPADKAGGGLHSEHCGDMGDSLGKERRAGSHRRRGAVVRWRRPGSSGVFR
jgi:hypothetical protein